MKMKPRDDKHGALLISGKFVSWSVLPPYQHRLLLRLKFRGMDTDIRYGVPDINIANCVHTLRCWRMKPI